MTGWGIRVEIVPSLAAMGFAPRAYRENFAIEKDDESGVSYQLEMKGAACQYQ